MVYPSGSGTTEVFQFTITKVSRQPKDGVSTPSWPLPRQPNQKRHILISLDADNILAQNFCQRWRIRASSHVSHVGFHVHVWKRFEDDRAGLACRCRRPQTHLGGYDEDFEPTGYQDADMNERLEALHTLRLVNPKYDLQGEKGGH